jgi:two-component system, NarL family, sensor kinase
MLLSRYICSEIRVLLNYFYAQFISDQMKVQNHQQLFFRILLAIFFSYLSFVSVFAQSIDALEVQLKSNDLSAIKRIDILNELSWQYVETNALKAQGLAVQAIRLAQNERNNKLLAVAYHRFGTALYNRNRLDSAKLIMGKAIALVPDDKLLGGILQEIGNIEADLGNYETASQNYFKALQIFEKLNDSPKTAQTLSNIGALYINLGDYDKMLIYSEKALVIHRKTGNKMGIAADLTNMADYYFLKKDSVKTIGLLTEAQKLFHELHATVNEVNVLGSIGDYYSEFQDNQNKAIRIYEQSLKLLTPGDNNNFWMDGYRKISLAYYKKNEYQKAIDYMQKAIVVTDSGNDDFVRMNYNLLAYDYIGIKNTEKAAEALDKYVELTDRVYRENQKKTIAEMEVKYETEKKQAQIRILEQDKKLQAVSIVALLAAILFLAVLGFFYSRNLNRKRLLVEKDAEIKAQRISELEKEKQLAASRALLEGENAERKRLARDLHDGLGGMLSVVKLNLINMKGNAILPESDVPAFHNALEMLDGSIRELRRVAHNLMPESLMRYGLKAALTDFCGSIDHVNLHYFGDDVRVDEKFEVAVFRIAHELVNNALKHSEASLINVQVIQESNRINLVVQDNGVGFNTEDLQAGKTTGLASIRSRIESLNGQLDFFSEPGKGTEVQVNFNF